jgi:hypothetical protein
MYRHGPAKMSRQCSRVSISRQSRLRPDIALQRPWLSLMPKQLPVVRHPLTML